MWLDTYYLDVILGVQATGFYCLVVSDKFERNPFLINQEIPGKESFVVKWGSVESRFTLVPFHSLGTNHGLR